MNSKKGSACSEENKTTTTGSNVIKLAAKEEAAEDHRISEGTPKGTYPKKEAAKADGGSSVRKGI